MKTIFSKFNNERLPKFQTVTKICQDSSGNSLSFKKAIVKEAKIHVDNIYSNYLLLRSTFKINIVKPEKIKDEIKFEIAKGVSFEELLIQTINENDEKKFKLYINQYIEYIDIFVNKYHTTFNPCIEFLDIFGNIQLDKPQDIIEIANIDLTFGNIFIHKNEFTLIDYEWIFKFPVPKGFIIWRAFNQFSKNHLLYKEHEKFKDILENIIDSETFIDAEKNFYNYVHGKQKKYILPTKLQKRTDYLDTDFKNIINKKNVIRSLTNQGEEVIEFSISPNNNMQEFNFKLSNNCKINNFGISLLSDFCVVKINSIYLIHKDGTKIDAKQKITSNAIIILNSYYYFNIETPYIYFNSFLDQIENTEQLIIQLQYIYLGKNALTACIKEIELKKETFYHSLLKTEGWKIVFFGASSALEYKLNALEEKGIFPDYVCDNDEKKDGTYFNSYKITIPKKIFGKNEKFIVLITSSYKNEIKEQLEKYDNPNILILD
tara:strand:+ start:46975 stop:48441 length:1467 start_codon:yes stop_codon:yes gene_type:complete